MTTHDLIVRRPTFAEPTGAAVPRRRLERARHAPLGEALAPHLPDAAIVSLQAPEASGPGWQWFSVRGVTKADSPARVTAAMPPFVQAVNQRQQACAMEPARTTLIGFSQGAIMALESTELEKPAWTPA